MPQTFDISQTPQPTPGGPTGPGSTKRGTGTALDDIARTILYITLAVMGVMFVYMLWALYGGTWSGQSFAMFDAATKARHLANIELLRQGMEIGSIVAIVCLLICSFRDEGIGYVFTAAAALFYAGIPYLTTSIYNWQGLIPTAASASAVAVFTSLGPIYAVPGVIFVLVDFVRRFQSAAEAAAIQRANVKYGSSVGRQTSKTQKHKFLGRCWELPYCRDHVRAKCPIYIRRRGPCWFYKEGCMCEERIVLQAVIANDWKDQAAAAGQKMHLTAAAPRNILSPVEKRERCRKCVIYNEHQRQKYKLLVGVTLVAVPVVLYLNKEILELVVGRVIVFVDSITKRFSLKAPDPGSNNLITGPNSWMLQDVLIGCLALVIIAQFLKLIEFLCFKLKV